jgi:DNA-binding transcriptional regulator YhcF (GntR family)
VIYSYITPANHNTITRFREEEPMKLALDSHRPIYLQIKEGIEEDIVNGKLVADEQIPSVNQMVNFYNINPVTILKGINLLVDEGTIYKKRGIGMFVSLGASERLKKRYSKTFFEEYIEPLTHNAKPLGFTLLEVYEMIERSWKGDQDD